MLPPLATPEAALLLPAGLGEPDEPPADPPDDPPADRADGPELLRRLAGVCLMLELPPEDAAAAAAEALLPAMQSR